MLVDLLGNLDFENVDYSLAFENNRPGKAFPFDKIPNQIDISFLIPNILTGLYLYLSQTRYKFLSYVYKFVNSTNKFIAFLFLLKKIRKNRPDLIVNYSTFSLFWVSFLNVKKVAWLHGNVRYLFGFLKKHNVKNVKK